MPASQFALEFDADLTVKGRDPHLLNQAADYLKASRPWFGSRSTSPSSSIDRRKVGVQPWLLLWGQGERSG